MCFEKPISSQPLFFHAAAERDVNSDCIFSIIWVKIYYYSAPRKRMENMRGSSLTEPGVLKKYENDRRGI